MWARIAREIQILSNTGCKDMVGKINKMLEGTGLILINLAPKKNQK